MSRKASVLSNFNIIDIAKQLNLNDLVFIGTQDTLLKVPKYKRKNKFYIINLDRLPENGGEGVGNHWVMLSTHSTPFYGDSYGTPPPKRIMNFIESLGYTNMDYLDAQIQSLKSEVCGWYALMLCDMMNQYYKKGKTFNQFINDFLNMGWDFDRQEKNNYKIVNKYFSNRI